MEWGPLLAAVVAGTIGIVSGLVGLYVANRKGMGGINREIEDRNRLLIDTLQDQVEALTDDFEQCKRKLERSQTSEESLYRRLRLAEGDLLRLYQRVGMAPPPRLEEPDS